MEQKFYPFRIFILAGMIYCLFSSWAFAVAGSQELLPSEERVAPWTKKDSPRTYDRDHLFEYINGGADIFLEYGFVEVVTQEYVKGDISFVVEIYQMEDPEAAFGIYSFSRDHRAPSLAVGADGTRTDYQIAFYQSNYYVVVHTFSKEQEIKKDMLAFAGSIAAKIPRKGGIPSLIKYLPQDNLIVRSEKLVKGILGFNNLHYLTDDEDIFGLTTGNKGVFANYELEGNAFLFFLLECKTPRKVQEVLLALEKFYEKKGEVTQLRWEKGSGGFSFKDPKGKYQMVKVKGRFLAALFDAPGEQEALIILRKSLTGEKDIQ
jgi:hypothetical protein